MKLFVAPSCLISEDKNRNFLFIKQGGINEEINEFSFNSNNVNNSY